MKRYIKKPLAVILSAIMLLSLLATSQLPAAAQVDEPELVVTLKSNFFPQQKQVYTDLSQYEDANGDVFITLEFKMAAIGKKIVDIDIDRLAWDPAVLEWDVNNNYYGSGRSKVLDVLPFAAEHNKGPGMINIPYPGRLVGNTTIVSNPPYAYNEDNSAVTIVRSVFKLIDRNTKYTTITCNLDTLSLCDEDDTQPNAEYQPIHTTEINDEIYSSIATYDTDASPEGLTVEGITGDINGSGTVTISDATEIQRALAEFTDDAGALLYDPDDPQFFFLADVNRDGNITISDATEIQRYLAEFTNTLD